jgi:hypothetical protein
MPRPKTEAAAYLDIYKLITEKTRLERELEALEQRRDRIVQRLEILDTQVETLENSAHQLRTILSPPPICPLLKSPTVQSTDFKTVILEY